MELLKSIKSTNQAKQYLKRAINRDDCELEFIYGSRPNNRNINRIEFLRMLNDFKQKYELYSESNQLDILVDNSNLKRNSLNNIRCTIDGISDIKKYCKTDSLNEITNVIYTNKSYYNDPHFQSLKFTPIVDYEYNYRINLKTEINLEESNINVQRLLHDWDNKLKYFRYKKRYSFITPDKLFKIDLTVVKSNKYNYTLRRNELYRKFVDSKILKNPETYELEIEYIGSNKINEKSPIDDFITKIHIDEDNQQKIFQKMGEESNRLYQIMEGDNAYSGTSFTPIEGGYPGPDEGYDFDGGYEFDEEIKPYFIPENRKTPFHKSSFQDIKYEYWIESDRLWLFESMLSYNKTLSYLGRKDNVDGGYVNSPKNSSYIEYEIYPKYTEEKIKNEKEFPEDFNNIIMVPVDDVVTITSYKKTPSWAPKSQKIEGIYYGGDYEIGPTYSPESPRLLPEELKSGTSSNPGTPGDPREKKWIPEPISEPTDVPLLTFDQMKEMGEFEDWELELDLKTKKKNFDKLNGINDNFVITKVLDIFKKNISDVLKIKEGTNNILIKSIKDDIINQYSILTQQETDRPKFMGPNPVSMSIENIIPDRKYSILEKYVVTEKADGIRSQLFISYNKGYLITQKLEIIDTNATFENIEGTWLFDGEYITKNKKGDDIQLFMIFDVYYAGDTKSKYPSSAFSYPWLSKKKKDICRYSIIQDFKMMVDIEYGDSSIRIGYKNYLEGPRKLQKSKKDPSKYSNINGILKQSKKILELDSKKDGFEYSIDGLIFMPMFNAVRSMEESSRYESIDGEWTINYKWKPPEENTIDFKVRIVNEEVKDSKRHKITSSIVKGKTIVCKQVYLYNGYNARDDELSDFNWKILSDERYEHFKEILFKPNKDKLLYKCNIPIKDNKMLCLKDNSEILDGSIVEMGYNPDNEEMRWIPLRVRTDKKYPNKSTTANNVWSTIIDPVTYDHITGNEDINKLKLEKESDYKDPHSYYIESENDNNSDESLRKLHNYIKQKLITSVCSIGNRPISIMDTSMGRGGDIGKYLNSKNKIEFLFGLDISPDINKSAKRFYLEKKIKPRKSMFIQYDTSESLKEGWGYKGDESNIERSQHLLNILYKKDKKIPKEYESINKIYNGLCNKGFDIISSQFSIHYYFKNEMTLRGYLQNLSDNCKKGGYFIGTCYDGNKVFDTLKDNSSFEMYDDLENKVFHIKKKYEIEDFNFHSSNIRPLFGQEIDVYMNSIGQSITEYLVNFDLLKDMMKEYNFKLVNPQLRGSNSGIFNKEKYTIEEGLGNFSQIIDELNNLSGRDPLLKSNKEDSKIKKGPYNIATDILKKENEKLRKLSSLNNWFIFQKY